MIAVWCRCDIGTLDDGRPYFVMDYIDGGSLEDLRKQGIDPVPAPRLCAEACRALDVLHAHDIIHRDVTPGNLLLSRTATGGTQVLIADLGVAKSMLDAAGATMTAGTRSLRDIDVPDHPGVALTTRWECAINAARTRCGLGRCAAK